MNCCLQLFILINLFHFPPKIQKTKAAIRYDENTEFGITMTELWMKKHLILEEEIMIEFYRNKQFIFNLLWLGFCVLEPTSLCFFLLPEKLTYLWPKYLGFMKNYQFIAIAFFLHPFIHPRISNASYFFPFPIFYPPIISSCQAFCDLLLNFLLV